VRELSHERSAFAAKLFADMGADVIAVEPPGGARMRSYAPFLDDRPGPERSLYWWHYNTSKRGITLDLESERGRELFRQLVQRADLVIEGEDPGRLEALGIDWPLLCAASPRLIWVSITPFGRRAPRAHEPATDLTVLAGGGPVWSCGYDDHSLPPIRGEGNQGYQTGCHYAVMAALVALATRDHNGEGQHVDVNLHAAANATTEHASYGYLAARETVKRQTGRHAGATRTMSTQIRCADGRYVNTGLLLRTGEEIGRLYRWVKELGLEAEFPEIFLLEMGMNRPTLDISKIGSDEEITAISGACREAINLIASKLSAYDFFKGSQERGMPVGIIYAPDEVLEDPHFVARGFPVKVEHPELGRSFIYPGAPYLFHGSPWRISRRAPLLGEHNAEVYRALGIDEGELGQLRAQGVI
jgi:crotonobetainyl-CoA:carnitine CoA-transferase CaiB-like acyl-CoA transferase